MAIEILEIHHTGVRIDTGARKLADTETFYKDVLGLARDDKRPTIPGIPGAWINVGEVGQIHLIGGEQPSPFAKGPGENPTRPHIAFAVKDIVATRKELESAIHDLEETNDELTATNDYPQVRNPAWARWRGLKAQALAATGRKEEALALADEEVALLRRWGAPSALGVSLRIRGELRGAAGVADLREALDLLTGTRASRFSAAKSARSAAGSWKG